MGTIVGLAAMFGNGFGGDVLGHALRISVHLKFSELCRSEFLLERAVGG